MADRLVHSIPTESLGQAFEILASAARTADSTTRFANPFGAHAFVLVIDVTADPASASVVFTIKGYDPASDKSWTILTSAAINGVGTTVLRVSPDLTAAANTIAKDIVPPIIEILADHADADSFTYSLGGHYAL